MVLKFPPRDSAAIMFPEVVVIICVALELDIYRPANNCQNQMAQNTFCASRHLHPMNASAGWCDRVSREQVSIRRRFTPVHLPSIA